MSQRSLITCIVTMLLLCLAGTFARAAAPTITNFAPARGVAGTVVTITGTDLNGATTVAFNGVPVKAFGTNSPTALFALVPEGATTGKITITNANGTATSVTDFAVFFGLKNNPKDGASMVWVPGGTYTMGNADGVGETDEHPAHQVTLTGYWIYQNDVTVAQYLAFCAATKHKLPDYPQPMIYFRYSIYSDLSWAGMTGWNDPALQKHPIVNVNWEDAKAYADWAGMTLPSEAQWEYAARGPKGNNYPWGGTATKADKYNGSDFAKFVHPVRTYTIGKSTWPVGSFPAGASWCGAQDMAGNVSQWCGDWFGDYSATSVTDPSGPATGKYRITRGGSWCTSDHGYRSAGRNINADGGNITTGFRCASLLPTTIAPTITTIAPTSAVVGTVITITGTNLDKVTAITFNGIAAKTITDNTATALVS